LKGEDMKKLSNTEQTVFQEENEVKEVAKERPVDSVMVKDGVYKYVYTDTGEDVITSEKGE